MGENNLIQKKTFTLTFYIKYDTTSTTNRSGFI